MDKLQDKILKMGPEEAAEEWGKFDEKMQTEYQPAIPIGYSGVAILHGSKIGGMAIDNVRGNPYFSNLSVKQ